MLKPTMNSGLMNSKLEKDKMDNLLTIDVEDYFQVENFKKVVKFSDWERHESRVAQNTEKMLEILTGTDAKATFFVLGWVGERYPRLVEKIHQAGHEVACHGYAHQLIYTQSKEEFRADLKKSKIILEDIIKEPVLGYRAPTYSITKESIWALDILMEEGFKYDSSVFPARRAKGGLPEAECYPHRVYNHQDYIWEFPISIVRILKHNFPFSGGGYFRLLPYGLVKSSIQSVNREGYPAIIYIHPWELDPKQPKVKADYISRFKHYVNIDKTEQKLTRVLDDFSFRPIRYFLNKEDKE